MLNRGLITLLIQVVRMLMQFSILVLMSRSLLIEEIGNFAIAVALISFFELLRDFGLRIAALDKHELSHQESTNIFWLSVFLGFSVFSVLNLVLLVFTHFQGESKIFETLHILSFSLMFSGLQAQFGVEMARRGRLLALGLTDFCAQFFAGIIGVFLILRDFGERSLFVQFICASVFLFLFRMILSDWFPTFPKKINSLNEMRKISKNLGKTQILNWAGSNVDTLILGMTSPNSSVGVYNRAYGLTLTPQQSLLDSLTNWVLPRSKIAKENYRDKVIFYNKLHMFLSVTFMPVIFVFIVFSEEIIALTLGIKWEPVVPIFQILCLAMIPNTYISFLRWSFIIEKETSLLLKITMYLRLVTVVLLIIGGLVSIIALALAIFISNIVTWILMSRQILRAKQNQVVLLIRREALFIVIGLALYLLF
jgi:O-antigen/teichoic acid export membrane protein